MINALNRERSLRKMTCKDCLHNIVCNEDKIMNHTISKSVCKHFKDKSLYKKFPCKVGNEVWFIKAMLTYYAEPRCEEIQKITIYQNDIVFRCRERLFSIDKIGRTVFLTKKEAEQALRR